jgi:2-oxo-4-hydroxy-4-carboxy-5-ureidoimidazoline decarboxylase
VDLAEFNALPVARAEEVLLDCCGSARWASRMAARRPFASMNDLCDAADSAWLNLQPADWLEAFGRHPQIGEKAATGSESSRRWAEGEQTGARAASQNVKERLGQGNRAYCDKFGYIFIVCASGKSAEEMLALLEQRLQNDPAQELQIAAEQQQLITRLRLEKLLMGERRPK